MDKPSITIDVDAACDCPKCRILRALGEPETELKDAIEAMGRVVALLTAGLSDEQQIAVRSVFALAWFAQTNALKGAEPIVETDGPPRAPTAH